MAADTTGFRFDINGLRAWAVISVILFHFAVPGFSGGFVGVDVFFVISGYLMTAIIITGLQRNTFSLLGFYLARARRIMPALALLCLLLSLLGWLFLPTSDFKLASKHAISALLFYSNFQFWKEASYFDAASQEKWFLHTWSLSVEWQFYMLLPVFCMLLWRWRGEAITRLALLGCGLLSLLAACWLSPRNPEMAFFLLPTRAWEMVAGGVTWWYSRSLTLSNTQQRVSEYVGMMFIVIAVLLFDEHLPWPGLFSLLPVLGACLMLLAGRQNSVLTANWLTQHLGLASYSLYLWHWPIVVWLNFAGLNTDIQWVMAGLLSCFILGFLSYHWIENPFRIRFGCWPRNKQYLALAVLLLLVLATPLWGIISRGANYTWRPGASSPAAQYMDRYSRGNYLTETLRRQYKTECSFYDDVTHSVRTEISPACTTQFNPQKAGIFLWGDSHAQALSFGVQKYLADGVNFYQVATSGCQPHIGPDDVTQGKFAIACDRANAFALEKIKALKPELVILAQQGQHDKNNYDAIIEHLKNIGVRQIILMGPVPQWQPSLPRAIAYRHLAASDKSIVDSSLDRQIIAADLAMTQRYALAQPGFMYISVIARLCNTRDDGLHCLAKVADNTPLVWDYGHLTPEGADFIVQELLRSNKRLSGFLK